MIEPRNFRISGLWFGATNSMGRRLTDQKDKRCEREWPSNTSTGGKFELEPGTVEDTFNTYAIDWKEGEISWSVDGQVYQTLKSWSSAGVPFPAPLDQSFYVIVNLAVGGNWPGNPDATTSFPARMEVDYVRVYQWIE